MAPETRKEPYEEAFEKGNYSLTKMLAKGRAEAGDARAEYYLGLLYRKGLGVEQNDHEAAQYFCSAAGKEIPEAQFNLARMYEKGRGLPQDMKLATMWYQLAADQGLAAAQCNLGNLYSSDTFADKDLAKAMTYYKLAAEQGFGVAQYNLGLLLYRNKTSTEKQNEGRMWLEKAAAGGNAEAQKILES